VDDLVGVGVVPSCWPAAPATWWCQGLVPLCTNIPVACVRVHGVRHSWHTLRPPPFAVLQVCCPCFYGSLADFVATSYHVLSAQLWRCCYAWHTCW